MIQSLHQINKFINARLIIAGSGSMKNKLQENSKSLNQNTIEFWDVPDGAVPDIQDQADILLLPIKKCAASNINRSLNYLLQLRNS